MRTRLVTCSLFLLLISSRDVFCQGKSSWQLWIVPSSYTLNRGDTLQLAFGLTGYGPLDPLNLKVIAYTEETTLISYANGPSHFDTYSIAPNAQAPKDRFTKKENGYPDNILLQCDHDSQFGKLYLYPTTSGDKRLLLVATYSPDGVSWYTTSRELSYHVNSWTEQHQTCLTLITIFAAIVAIPFVDRIPDYIKSRSKRKKA